MSEGDAPRLLVRERVELDAVAMPLREGRRVVAFLVCEAALRPVVLEYLRDKSGVAIPEMEGITDAFRMLDVLTEAANIGPREVRSIAVDYRVEEVLRTLNWHREKLRKGASVLMWVEGVEGLRALRALAPDAYSFRDVMVMVRGEERAPVVGPDDEAVEVKLARIPYEAADTSEARAQAAVDLATVLTVRGSSMEALRVLTDGLAVLPRETYPDTIARTTRAAIYHMLAKQYRLREECASAWRSGLCGLDELADTNFDVGRVLLLSSLCTPFGVSSVHVHQALVESLPIGAPASVLNWAAFDAWNRGDLRSAADFLMIASGASGLSVHDRITLARAHGQVSRSRGDLSAAEEQFRRAAELRAAVGTGTASLTLPLAQCLVDRAELDAAKRIFVDIIAGGVNDVAFEAYAARVLAGLSVQEGDVSGGFCRLRTLIHDASDSSRDGHLYESCVYYVSALRAAHEAGRLSSQDLMDADVELAVAEDVAVVISGPDPAWYSILFPGLRAEVLSLRPDRLGDAISLAAAALDRARAVWTDAVPMHARMHAAHVVRAGRLDEARAAIAVAKPEAGAQRHLRELARLQVLAVTVLVRAAAPEAEIDAEMKSLRATLDETSAPRIAAETLLELSQLLPPETRRPDPLDLLDEVHALFLDMPIVAEEARCLETMGDVLAARGAHTHAHRRYLAAKALYERYGLGLRLPLVTTKVDRTAGR